MKCCHKWDYLIDASIISSHLLFRTTSKICLKYLPSVTIKPPNGLLSTSLFIHPRKYPRLLSIASKHFLSAMSALSYIINDAFYNNFAKCVLTLMLHIDLSCISKGIRNCKWVVWPPRNKIKTILEIAITRITFSSDLIFANSVFHKCVFPIP